jgi:hypothetical protein
MRGICAGKTILKQELLVFSAAAQYTIKESFEIFQQAEKTNGLHFL